MTPNLTFLPLFVFPAPSPTTAVHYLATKCVDTAKHRQEKKWFMPWGPNKCDKIQTFDEAMAKKIEANNIVFAIHMPLPSKEMSPWFQFMLVILQFDIIFKMYNQIRKNQTHVSSFDFPHDFQYSEEGGHDVLVLVFRISEVCERHTFCM